MDGTSGEYIFYLKDFNEKISALDVIQATQQEIDEAQKLANGLIKSGKTSLEYIKKTLVENLSIEGLDKAKDLDKCIDFMILQSLSAGISDINSNKLHSLVIGPPGVGKKLLTIIAKILNPVFEEVSSTGSKITAAGLIGNVQRTNSEVRSNPGLIPRASSGVICIQDFHSIKRNRSEVFSVFSEVMEDGKSTDSTSARQTHETATSIHIDTNKYSQVDPSGKGYTPLSDIDIPMNILSRFDFIMEIPPDLDRQLKVAYKLAREEGGFLYLSTYGNPKLELEWYRELKVLVAYLREYFIAEFRPHINEYIEQELKKMVDSNGNKEFMADFILRITISIRRFVKALVSANHQLYAHEQFVDLAFKYIKPKIEFLQSLSDKVNIVPDLTTERGKIELIKTEFAGREFSVKDIKNALVANGKNELIPNIHRYFKKACVKVRYGIYKVLSD